MPETTDENLPGPRRVIDALPDSTTAPWLPESIGNYTVVRQIGQGGMGVVYEAVQRSPRRSVAIKLLHATHATPELLRRFRREAELLGHLQHPGIAQIIEASTFDHGHGPQPFFAMELVQGVPLTEYADEHDLDTAARLELIAELCDILQYAHQQGVVHRDLKPANILVTTAGSSSQHDTTRTSLGRPKILDFGIARATDADLDPVTLQTTEGQLIGTVQYMSPEQASGDPQAIDTRCDVYAVGVLCFELLAGKLPHDFRGMLIHDAIRVLREDEPSNLGSIDRALRGDVETIVRKALEKDKERRYSSAAELASDIRRHLQHVPIEARPPSAMYQLRKFARRNKAIVGGAAATLLVAVTGAIVALQFAFEATARADELERASYVMGIAIANTKLERHNIAKAAAYLEDVPEAHRGWEYDHLRASLVHHVADWDVEVELSSDPVFDVEGRRMFAARIDGTIGTWDVASGRLLATTPLQGDGKRGPVTSNVALSGRSLRFAELAADGDVIIGSLTDGVREHVLEAPDPDSRAHGVPPWAVHAWDAAGEHLLYRAYETRIWDGERSQVLTADNVPYELGAFHPDGDRVVLTRIDRIALFDVASSELLVSRTLDEEVLSLAFAPDGKTLAVACKWRTLFLLNADTLEVERYFTEHEGPVFSVAWNAAGSALVTCSGDQTVRVWDPDQPRSVAPFYSGVATRSSVAVMPDGEYILMAGSRLRIFPIEDPRVLRGHASYVYSLSFSPDGAMLASTGWMEPEIHVWDVRRARPLQRLRGPELLPAVNGDTNAIVAFSSDSKRLVSSCGQGTVHYDVADGSELPVPSDPELGTQLPPDPNRSEGARRGELTARSRYLFVKTLGGRRDVNLFPQYTLSANLRRYAVAHPAGTVELYDLDPHTPVELLTPLGLSGHPAQVHADHGSLSAKLEGHEGRVWAVAFSPDGTRLASGGDDKTIRIWDTQTHEQLLVLSGHESYVKDLEFSPDGTMLASASGDKTIRLWDTVPIHERRAMSQGR